MQITFGGNKVTVKGDVKKVGDKAPDFKVIGNDLNEVNLSDFNEDYIVISAVPSIDTGVCDFQTKKFNQVLGSKENVKVLTVSNDLPFAQKRWCANEGLDNVITLSDHKDLDFAMKYGTLIEDHRLQVRSVFVLDKERNIVYLEYVSEVTDHPDYDKVIELLK